MNTVNETGPQAGRYLYRTHETGANGSLSVVDLKTGEAKVLVQRADFNRLDGLRWTPWGTLLFAEETAGGRLYEVILDPKIEPGCSRWSSAPRSVSCDTRASRRSRTARSS